MRLIDADKLIEHFEKVKKESASLVDMAHILGFQRVIDAQPTAYDPDKVVEQLKKCAKGNCVRNSDSGRCPYIGNSEIDCEKCAMLRAIEIVKAGGGDAD